MAFPQGQRVLVVGGSAGLGRHLAEAFTLSGAHIGIVARRTAELELAADLLRGLPHGTSSRHPRVETFVADVTRDEDVVQLASQVQETFGGIDVVIHCVGRSSRGRAAETKPADFQTLWELNFLTLVRVSQAMLPLLSVSRGTLVAIGSLASKSPGRFLGAYPASKYAVAAYSHQLRLELAPTGVHVLLVCPGPIQRPDAGERYASQTHGLPAESAAPGGGVKLKGLEPARLAAAVLQAIDARQPELVLPGKARWLFAISQVSPRWGDWLLSKFSRSSH